MSKKKKIDKNHSNNIIIYNTIAELFDTSKQNILKEKGIKL